MSTSRRSLPQRLVGALVVLLALAFARRAEATITITQSLITYQQTTHSDPVSRLYISRSDCAVGNVMTFPVGLTEFGGNLQVWATDGAADCTLDSARGSDAATCFEVYDSGNLTQTFTVNLPVQNIVAKSRSGTVADCDNPKIGSGTNLQQVTLYFLLVNGSAVVPGNATNWSTKIDLNGPVAPTGVNLGRGGSLLKIGWDVSVTDPDIAGYNVYCDSRDQFQGVTPPTGATSTVDAAACPSTALADAGDTDAAGDDDGGARGGGDSASGAPSSDGCSSAATPEAATPVTDNGCSSVLPAGQIPTVDLERSICATSPGKQSGTVTITGLTNRQLYNFAVSAYDVVGNSGPLSDVICGFPEPVFGFTEAYHDQGGTAGGGFCSLGRVGAAGARGGLGALVMLAALVAARRRNPRDRMNRRFDRVSQR
jgi:hypothetical protein